METGTVTILLDNGTVSSSSYSIEPAGVFVFQERRMPGPLMVGTLRIDPDRNTNTPAGAGIFSLSSAGFLVTESGIPSADPTNHARLYIDTSSGHDTGIALATTGDSAVNVRMSAYELNGITPVGTSAVVNVSTHRAQFVSQLIPGLPSGFVGVLDIAADGPFAALALRSLINGRGDFLLTTLPVADANATAVSPLVFPQIADGAGYTTEFILISPGAASKTTLYFYGEDGQPLALNINRRQ
jgi:hypothetical protein